MNPSCQSPFRALLAAGLVISSNACITRTNSPVHANGRTQAPTASESSQVSGSSDSNGDGKPSQDTKVHPESSKADQTPLTDPDLIAYEFPEGALETIPGAAIKDLPVSRVAPCLLSPRAKVHSQSRS